MSYARTVRLGVAALLALLLPTLLACQRQPPLDTYGPAPDFTLTDQSGQPFAASDLAGRVALVDFIYTNCPDACPLMTANLAKAQQTLKDQKLFPSRVAFVSVSVDPLRDTPPVLAQYAQKFGVDGEGWKFVTGDWDQTYQLLADLKLQPRVPRPASGQADATELSHTTRMIVLDGQRQIRAYLSGTDATPDDIVKTLQRALG